MGIQVRLLLTMVLMLVLPMSVSVITWAGLKQMDVELQQVTEEFAEARSLQPVDSELTVAAIALKSEGANFEAQALRSLRRAEEVLLEFLAEQYGSVSSVEHQADEADIAARMLAEMRDLIGDAWPEMSNEERAGRVLSIRAGLRELYEDADTGVLTAPAAAQRTRERTLVLVLTAAFVSAGICVLLSVWSTRGVILRLRELRDAMLRQSDSQDTPEPRSVLDVMSQLEQLNKRVALRLEDKDRELLRRERMAGIGLLAADVAHEINNPLNAMLGLSELSLRATAEPVDEASRAELHDSLTVIRREILRCRGIVQRLMAMVRRSGEVQSVVADRLLSETLDIAKAARPDRASCFILERRDSNIRIRTSPEDVRQILLTLLINAADAVPVGGRITVDATRADGEVWLRVRDNGRGFTPETKADFDIPLVTTRAGEGGTGLGLSIAYTIASDIGAEIRAESAGAGKGSVFIVAFPDEGDGQ